ncbi:AraC family transcriptional regulator [Hafnia paralvei]|uniref:reactive chlorine-specific transcriptional regulator RclR n=1 Tax=Hafnia paralvei TaxID=546367 RepID=UPI000DF3A6E5|nr:reactive chlorine-specific transcriptional regulator RclR [Hafnia paralvei]RDA61892.1 AraC family transcriptional regulator [Hafnia paralvei]RDA62953.1 AraC family transcriptional regulator [Hafnia paralvei]RDA63793.1 AraC family transcriptional regulator [Hafnia paralvei]RDA75079.1 AraC family transcriptional regulator [Hafnia paralvei]RDA75483.1 AraC family transcriptional regulator [Hafnia paralvei]
MDPLSNLLLLNAPEGSVDKDCPLEGDWQLLHAAGEISVIRWHTVTHGTAWLDMPSGHTCRFEPSTVIFLPHNDAHRLRYHKDEGTHIVCGHLRLPESTRYFLATLPEVLMLIPKANTPDYHWIKSTISLLQQEANSQQLGAFSICSQQCAALFTLALRTWLNRALPDKGLITLLVHPRLGILLPKMLESPAFPWTVEYLAREVNMSRAAFALLFRNVTGTTPLAVLTTLRLYISKQLISRQSKPIIDVAESVGYANESSFHKAFVRQFGYTPSEYRKRVKYLGGEEFVAVNA